MGRPVGQTVGQTFGDAVDFTSPYLWSFGAAERDERSRVIIGSKRTLEALKFFKALWDDAMDPAGVGWDAPSIYLTALNQVILDDKGEPLANDIAHVPTPAGPAGVFHYHYSQQLAVPRYSKNVDAAKDFIRWLMDKDQLSKYLRRGQAHQATALKAYTKDPMWDMFPALKPYRDHLLEGQHVGWRGPADAKAARVVQNYVLIDMLANVAMGKMSPEESLKWAEGQLKVMYCR